MRRAGEAAVGDERHVVAQARADDGGRHAEHLAHARPADRAFVADDDDPAGLARAPLGGGEALLPAVHGPRAAPGDAPRAAGLQE